MKTLQEIVSNLPISKTLKQLKQENLLSHAYLFVSPDSMLLNSFCQWFAGIVLNDYTQVLSRSHADLKYVNQKPIGVDIANMIVSDVYSMPIEADYKVYVLFDANNLTEEAQNKLLKTLEEPPKSSIIILAATAENNLLATIKSRVTRYELGKLDNNEILSLLSAENIGANVANLAASKADGNYTKAIGLALNENTNILYELSQELFSKLNSSKDILFYESKINLQKFDFEDFLDFAILLARDIMIIKLNKQELVFNKADISTLNECANGFNLKSITKVIEILGNAKKDLSFNANPQAVLDELLLKIVEAKVTCK